MLQYLTSDLLAASLPALVERWRPGARRWALVVDADRTLAPDDTGRRVGEAFAINEPIRAVFEALGYVEEAFRRVSGIWSEVPPDRYLVEIERVAVETRIYGGWTDLFSVCLARIPIFVVSVGIPLVWRRILASHGFPEIPVIGGCHVAFDRHFICPRVKEALVLQLQQLGFQVAAAGDSLIDEPMLRAADLPLFVPDPKGSAALRQSLADDPRVYHLKLDERTFSGLRVMAPQALSRLLTDAGEGYADAPL
jgi:phosphoserine phosphatase